jgi:hypothetical protein
MPRKKRIPVSPVLDIVAGDFAGHPSAPSPSKVREYMPFFHALLSLKFQLWIYLDVAAGLYLHHCHV